MAWLLRVGGLLAAVLLVAAAGLWAMGTRADAGRLETAVVIHAPPDRVWPWLIDPEKLKRWVDWLVDVNLDIGAPQGVGAISVWQMRDEDNAGQLIQVQNTCVEYTPPRHLVVELLAPGSFVGQRSYTLTPLGSGSSRLEIEAQYRYIPWFARLIEPLVTPLAQKKLTGDGMRLKGLVESGAS